MTHHPIVSALLLTALWAAAAPSARAQGTHNDFLRSNPRFLLLFREVVAEPSQATVRIRADDKDIALGVIVGADGWILTKAFDLKGKLTCTLKDGREYDAKIVGVHTLHDLAVLKIDASDLPAVTFKASKTVPVGSWVASVGTGADPVAVGIVSVPTRDVLFKGLPIAAADLSKIGYLGVALESAEGRGVRVTQVLPGTPAAKAGLQHHDVILKVAGMTVRDPEQFQLQMVKHRPGDQVTLHVQRGDDELDLEATLQKRPVGDNRGEIQNNMGSQLSARRSGYPTILTHDSVVKPADCGGPLVDLDGNVIGINISRAGRTESWTIPTEVIQDVLAELKSGKLAPTRDTQAAAGATEPAASPMRNRRNPDGDAPRREDP
jgi:serine protease Do